MIQQIKSTIVVFSIVAFAITVTVSAFANHRPEHNPPGHSKGQKKFHNKSYGKPNNARRGGPPSWVPAWGTRKGKKVRYEKNGVEHEAGGNDLVKIPTAGIGQCDREVIGAILGSVVGTAVGSNIRSGSGKKLATIGGSIIGGSIGRTMDEADQNCVGQVLERTPNGKTVIWNNPDRNGQYKVTPTRTYQTRAGTYCREYKTQIVIGGHLQNAFGKACRQSDGSWKKI